MTRLAISDARLNIKWKITGLQIFTTLLSSLFKDISKLQFTGLKPRINFYTRL